MKLHCFLALSLFSFLAAAPPLRAQVGNGNPTGPSGSFNGNVTTGCSYDPFTGNATRAVTDLVVPGAVGAYPLAFGRTSNSRSSFSREFGSPGSWRHSYNWGISGSETSHTTPGFVPTFYTVFFPDGRVISFTPSGSGPYFRGPLGVRERFQPLDMGTLRAYLLLADGGKIEFQATRVSECDFELLPPCTYSYTYQAKAIIDPHGLRTVLAYNGDGTLNTITEPAGRWIQIGYATTPWLNGSGFADRVIDSVTSSDGRSVKYNYGAQRFPPGTMVYTYLGNVVYFGDNTIIAAYTYQAPNVGSANLWPLLSTCNDPMYDGPMKKIAYEYATGVNGDNSTAVVGQIKSEKSGTTGAVVSTLGIVVTGRVETKGSGGNRQFTYDSTQVQSWSDYVSTFPRTGKQYDATTRFLSSIQDRNGNVTNYSCDPKTGNVKTITFPLTPPDTTRAVVTYTYGSATCPDPNNRDDNNPYYLYSITNELGKVTTYLRDPKKRITRINYPDGAYETFAYDDVHGFNQVLSHRMTSGGTETFTYNATGLVQTYRDPDHATGNPTARYQYDALGRLSGVTDARGTVGGDINYTTSYGYNARGQLTQVTHPVDTGTGTRFRVLMTYNSDDGTLARVTDELNHSTNYAYDDYGRVLTATDPLNRTTTNSYLPWGKTDSYVSTAGFVFAATAPSGKKVYKYCDLNGFATQVTAAPGTSDEASTTYTYDPAGNLATMKDPNGQASGLEWSYFYDPRNRLIHVRDPISTDRNSLGYTISYGYDLASNKKSVLRANGQLITYDYYDEMNRLTQQTERQPPSPNAVTVFTYTEAGLIDTMTDPRAKIYDYDYDLLNRLTSLTFPADSGGVARKETRTYDLAGNLATFKNRAGDVQSFSYDARNREVRYIWDSGDIQTRILTYDGASNITACDTLNSTHINFVYYDDNRLKSQEVWTSYYGDNHHRTLTSTYDEDGNRTSTTLPGLVLGLTYEYTGRNQPWKVSNTASGGVYVTYGYDASGNRTVRRLNNGTLSTYLHDPLNRVTSITHPFANGTATLEYGYDKVGNRKYVQRDDGPADGFGYDLKGQLTSFQRDGALTNGVVSGGTATSLVYDASGNRSSRTAGGTTFNYSSNGLNQYSGITGVPAPTYDANGNLKSYNGWTYTYDAMNRLVVASGPGATANFSYDGLNRQVARSITGIPTKFSVWDGWELYAEYEPGNVWSSIPIQGAAGDLLEEIRPSGVRPFFFGDGLGSTSHVGDSAGNLIEKYSYDAFGAPRVYEANGVVRPGGSAFGVNYLFAGQRWIKELALSDNRHRFYSPEIGRFLQPDPIGFAGDPTNLYRYCGNNPVNNTDPFGLIERHTFTLVKPDVPKQGPSFPMPGFVNGAMDWGPLEQVLEYMGEGDHGRFGGGFRGFGDGPLGGGEFSLGPALPSSPPLIPSRNDPYYPYIPINPYNNQPLIFPPSIDPRALVAAAQQANSSWNPLALPTQILSLRPGGPLDMQLKGSNLLYQNAGNWLFGAEGAVMGVPLKFLLFIGGVTNHAPGIGAYGDDPEDTFMIQLGFDYGH